MRATILAAALGVVPAAAQTSRPQPTSRPQRTGAERPRMLKAKWGEDAPGRAVMPGKLAAIRKAPYCSAKDAAKRVHDDDIVIGIRVGKQAVAYPIHMLGGPSREIINEEIAGVPFAVNW